MSTTTHVEIRSRKIVNHRLLGQQGSWWNREMQRLMNEFTDYEPRPATPVTC
jgi:hypothetical protein